MSETEWVVLATFPSHEEAASAITFLASFDIQATLDESKSSSAFPNFQITSGIDVLTQESDRERGLTMLEERDRNVPISENPDAGRLAEAEAAVRSEREPNRSIFPVAIFAIIILGAGFALGHYLTVAGLFNALPYATDVITHDANHDGHPDIWYHVSKTGRYLRCEEDRNYDRKPDAWYKFGETFVTSSESDQNFDGKVDAWIAYAGGKASSMKSDCDGDGIVDMVERYEFGILAEIIWAPGNGKTVRREIYRHGVLSEVHTLNAEGVLQLVETGDRFGITRPVNARP